MSNNGPFYYRVAIMGHCAEAELLDFFSPVTQRQEGARRIHVLDDGSMLLLSDAPLSGQVHVELRCCLQVADGKVGWSSLSQLQRHAHSLGLHLISRRNGVILRNHGDCMDDLWHSRAFKQAAHLALNPADDQFRVRFREPSRE